MKYQDNSLNMLPVLIKNGNVTLVQALLDALNSNNKDYDFINGYYGNLAPYDEQYLSKSINMIVEKKYITQNDILMMKSLLSFTSNNYSYGAIIQTNSFLTKNENFPMLKKIYDNSGNIELMKLVLDHVPANYKAIYLNYKPSNSKTLLHEAIIDKDIETIKFLMDNHADPKIKDNKGKNAFDLANGDKLILDILKGHDILKHEMEFDSSHIDYIELIGEVNNDIDI